MKDSGGNLRGALPNQINDMTLAFPQSGREPSDSQSGTRFALHRKSYHARVHGRSARENEANRATPVGERVEKKKTQ